MGKCFSHLTFKDRQMIERQLKRGISKTVISQKLEISLSGLYHELKRIPNGTPYTAKAAHADCLRKSKSSCSFGKLRRHPELAAYIATQISENHLSPAAIVEQINANESPFPPNSISLSTIYNQIHTGAIPGVQQSPAQKI